MPFICGIYTFADVVVHITIVKLVRDGTRKSKFITLAYHVHELYTNVYIHLKAAKIAISCSSVRASPLGTVHSRMARLILPYVIISGLMTSTQGGRRVIKTTPRLASFSPSALSSFFPVARSSARRLERGKLAKNFSGRDISISIQGLFKRQWKQLLSDRDARVTTRRSDDGLKQELKGEKEILEGLVAFTR